MSSAPGAAPAPVVNLMSIDVEDYFHVSVFDGIVPRSQWDRMESRVVQNTTRLLDLFDEFDVRSTFFVLGWVGDRHPDLVKTIARRGHEIASHGYAHRLIYDQTPAAFREDIRRAKRLLEDACGRRVVGYRAPSYSITPKSLWALDALLEEGYEYDSSIFPIRHDRYGIPVSARGAVPASIDEWARLVEVPGSTTQVGPLNLPVAGGGYFRILPYWWTKWGISRVNQHRGAACRVLSASLGDRSRPAAAGGRPAWPVPALPAPGGHGEPPATTVDRLSLRLNRVDGVAAQAQQPPKRTAASLSAAIRLVVADEMLMTAVANARDSCADAGSSPRP